MGCAGNRIVSVDDGTCSVRHFAIITAGDRLDIFFVSHQLCNLQLRGNPRLVLVDSIKQKPLFGYCIFIALDTWT